MWTLLIAAQFLAFVAALVSVIARRVPIPIFAAYLAFELVLGGVSLWTQAGSEFANMVWVCGQFLTTIFWIAVFLEIRSVVLSRYPGIGIIADYFTAACLVIGLAVVWFTASDDRRLLMRLAIFVPRIAAGTLFVAMTLLAVLMRHYRTDHTPNMETHARLFWLFMGAQAISMWSTNLAPADMIGIVSVAKMILSFICIGSWAVLLRQHREVAFVPTISQEELRAAQLRSQRALDELRDVL